MSLILLVILSYNNDLKKNGWGNKVLKFGTFRRKSLNALVKVLVFGKLTASYSNHDTYDTSISKSQKW